MGLPGLILLGLGGLALYQASRATASSLPASNGSRVQIPGLVVPTGVSLTSTDVKVARWVIDTSIKYVLPDGSAQQTRPASGHYLAVAGLSAADRLAALQYGVGELLMHPEKTLFDAIGGF